MCKLYSLWFVFEYNAAWLRICLFPIQGLDGPSGDKGDDGEAGQPVSVPFLRHYGNLLLHCKLFHFDLIFTLWNFKLGFPWTHWRVWSLWTTRKKSEYQPLRSPPIAAKVLCSVSKCSVYVFFYFNLCQPCVFLKQGPHGATGPEGRQGEKGAKVTHPTNNAKDTLHTNSVKKHNKKWARNKCRFVSVFLCERESLVWKVPKERRALLVLKDHLASLVLKVSGVSPAQWWVKCFVPSHQFITVMLKLYNVKCKCM